MPSVRSATQPGRSDTGSRRPPRESHQFADAESEPGLGDDHRPVPLRHGVEERAHSSAVSGTTRSRVAAGELQPDDGRGGNEAVEHRSRVHAQQVWAGARPAAPDEDCSDPEAPTTYVVSRLRHLTTLAPQPRAYGEIDIVVVLQAQK